MADRTRVLIVDDEIGIRNQLKWGLCDAFDVRDTGGVPGAKQLIASWQPDVLLLDVHLEDGARHGGFDLLEFAVASDPLAKGIMVTGEDDPALASRAIELGAWDYYAKPIDTDELRIVVSRAARVRELQRGGRQASAPTAAEIDYNDLESWLGTSAAARRVARLIRSLATSSEPVLVLGESGTGRELAVETLHSFAHRPPESFVVVDPKQPLPQPDSMADRGTYMIVDVTELPESSLQQLPEWAETAQERGRVVVCGPADLAERAAGEEIPSRTYNFLAALTVALPPLRDRDDDVQHIANAMLIAISVRVGMPAKSLSAEALTSLTRYGWPGNLRELERRLTGAFFVATGDQIDADDLWPPAFQANLGLKDNLKVLERTLVERAVREHHGNVSRAAKSLDVSRPTLHSLLRKHDIDPDPFRASSGS